MQPALGEVGTRGAASPPSQSLGEQAARIFTQCASVLRSQKANPFRVNAYLEAAKTLRSLTTDVHQILDEEGLEGLMNLPGIGRGLAAAVDEIARTGRLSQLDRLRGNSSPEALFQSVPGIGPTLARTIHDALDIDTLEALEIAAHDGRLEHVPGIGPRRAAAIRASLTDTLRRGQRFRRNPFELRARGRDQFHRWPAILSGVESGPRGASRKFVRTTVRGRRIPPCADRPAHLPVASG